MLVKGALAVSIIGQNIGYPFPGTIPYVPHRIIDPLNLNSDNEYAPYPESKDHRIDID